VTLELGGVKDFVETLMDDTVSITRDAAGTSDDIFDETTGSYFQRDAKVIYDGKAWISYQSGQSASPTEGGIEVDVEVYTVNVPVDAPEIKELDCITVTASLRNPNLVGKKFYAKASTFGTFKVRQKVRMELTTPQALR
jgi:hypothetical protein